jgi:hypothetical protein
MGPADVAPWLEQVGDGLAKKVSIGLEADISEFADGHQAAQQRSERAAQPDPVAGGDRRVTQDLAEPLLDLLVVTVMPLDVQARQGRLIALRRRQARARAAELLGPTPASPP